MCLPFCPLFDCTCSPCVIRSSFSTGVRTCSHCYVVRKALKVAFEKFGPDGMPETALQQLVRQVRHPCVPFGGISRDDARLSLRYLNVPHSGCNSHPGHFMLLSDISVRYPPSATDHRYKISRAAQEFISKLITFFITKANATAKSGAKYLFHMGIWDLWSRCKHECEGPSVPNKIITQAKRRDMGRELISL